MKKVKKIYSSLLLIEGFMMKRFYIFALILGVFSLQHASPLAAHAPGPAPDFHCDVFPSNNIWNTRVDSLPTDPALTTKFLNDVGTGQTMLQDFASGEWPVGSNSPIGIPLTVVNGSQPLVRINYTAYGHESDPGPFPIPANAAIEGGPNSTGDRHVLVLDETNCVLYELYRAFPQPDGSWNAEAGARYDLNSNALRPLNWTSADAAGLPILPGLVRYQEILEGSINHAIRVNLTRTADAYVWPARHEASSLPLSQYLPMGSRLRLRADFDISGFDPVVQIILQAMKTYGLIVADHGNNMVISGMPDTRWNDTILRQFRTITSSNFEVVDTCSLRVDPHSGAAQLGANLIPNSCSSQSPVVTPMPSATIRPTNTLTFTPTIRPTNTPTLRPTNTPIATIRPTNTLTFTPTIRPTNTPTPRPTNTPFPTPRPTDVGGGQNLTPTIRPTNTPTYTPTIHPTNTPTLPPTNTVMPMTLGSRVVVPSNIRARTNFVVVITLDNPASAAGGGIDAMEIQCTASPSARLIGQSYSNGVIFGPNPLIVAQATPSSIVYAVSQTGTNPPVRVGGTALSLTIRAASAGQGTITCAVEVIDGNGATTLLNVSPVTFTVR
jgi:hypothetical protein